MKKVEIEGTTKTIMYEAIDGTRFNNEAECVKYDNTALAVIKSRLKFIKKTDLKNPSLQKCKAMVTCIQQRSARKEPAGGR